MARVFELVPKFPYRCPGKLVSLTFAAGIAFALSGCAIPLLPFAPSVPNLPEPAAQATAIASLGPQGSTARLAVRSGRVLRVAARPGTEEMLASLPSATRKGDSFREYISPPIFRSPQAGESHYFNFQITPDYAQASNAYYSGSGEAALAAADRILATPGAEPRLAWQASYLRFFTLLLMGRPDLADFETKRTEQLELTAMGGNHAARSLRAEVRYWSGDIEGAVQDAAQVVRAFGGWRFPTVYPTPPIDQVQLARMTEAQIRSMIILGLSLLAKQRPADALPWLALAEEEMNNVMFVNRHPLYGIYFPAYRELGYYRGFTLISYGAALIAAGRDLHRVETVFDRARQYFDAIGYALGNVLAETFRAQSLIMAKRYQEAKTRAEKGLALAEQAQLLEFIWRLEALKGDAELALRDTESAERSFRRAQATADLMAGTAGIDEGKVRFGIGQERITQALVEIDLLKRDLPTLFEDLERGRARAFVALLANRQVATGREPELVGQMKTLEREILIERQRKNALTGAFAGNPRRERELLEKRVEVMRQLRSRDRDLADALSVSAASLADVQNSLPRDAVLVYYLPISSDKQQSSLLIRRESAEVRALSNSSAEIRGNLLKFRGAVDRRDTRSQIELLGDLARALKIAEWGRPSVTLVVPSGDMHFVPWGALDLAYPVAVLPNGAWVTRTQAPLPSATRAVVLGDPAFGGLLEQLPGARAEAQSIAGQYAVKALIGEEATESRLRSHVGRNVDVLHLATHALFDPVFPLQSSLILTDGKTAVPLSAERLFERPLAARVVVLSACETGMGQVAAGDDLIGLSRSFYLGGAAAVLSSLWPVEDQATRLFMETFHASAAEKGYGGAWLAARDAVRARGAPPSSYGAFVLGGAIGQRK